MKYNIIRTKRSYVCKYLFFFTSTFQGVPKRNLKDLELPPLATIWHPLEGPGIFSSIRSIPGKPTLQWYEKGFLSSNIPVSPRPWNLVKLHRDWETRAPPGHTSMGRLVGDEGRQFFSSIFRYQAIQACFFNHAQPNWQVKWWFSKGNPLVSGKSTCMSQEVRINS